MKVLITGVAGFIGSHVAARFAREGHDVAGVDDLSSGKRENIPPDIEFVRADLADSDIVAKLPAKCDLILHLAGQSSGEISFDDPVADLQKNTVSTLHLIRYGIRNQTERIVYASSMSVYGSVPDAPISEAHEPIPLSCYGVGKLAAEGYLRVYSDALPFVTMRMFNVYGPGQDLSNLRQGMVSIYLAQALSTGRIEVKGSTDRFRDFVYIDDVVEAWSRAAICSEAKNQTLNIGTGCRTTVRELLDALRKSVPDAEYFVKGSTPGDQAGIYADVTRLRRILAFDEFMPLEKGLESLVAWAREAAPGPITVRDTK